MGYHLYNSQLTDVKPPTSIWLALYTVTPDQIHIDQLDPQQRVACQNIIGPTALCLPIHDQKIGINMGGSNVRVCTNFLCLKPNIMPHTFTSSAAACIKLGKGDHHTESTHLRKCGQPSEQVLLVSPRANGCLQVPVLTHYGALIDTLHVSPEFWCRAVWLWWASWVQKHGCDSGLAPCIIRRRCITLSRAELMELMRWRLTQGSSHR